MYNNFMYTITLYPNKEHTEIRVVINKGKLAGQPSLIIEKIFYKYKKDRIESYLAKLLNSDRIYYKNYQCNFYTDNNAVDSYYVSQLGDYKSD